MIKNKRREQGVWRRGEGSRVPGAGVIKRGQNEHRGGKETERKGKSGDRGRRARKGERNYKK